MKKKNINKIKYQYYRILPDALRFQTFTKICLMITTWLLKMLSSWAVIASGRVAITSGDFLFLFTSWQGWIVLISAVVLLFVYVAFDIITKIYYCSYFLENKPTSFREALQYDFTGIRKFMNPMGFLVVLYVVLIVPLVGGRISVSLTSNLYIPSFIQSVIDATPMYSFLYTVGILALSIVGFLHAFVFHGVLISGLSVRESLKDSRKLIIGNLKNYLIETALFSLGSALFVVLVAVLAFIIPSAIGSLLFLSENNAFNIYLFAATFAIFTTTMAVLVVVPFNILKITHLYYSYKGLSVAYEDERKTKHISIAFTLATVLIISAVATYIEDRYSDILFPSEVTTGIIAHRGGGNEAAENSLAGLKTAVELGAYGSEIDIQRTSDGHYVINHDTTFERLTGNPSKPEDLTLAEVRSLTIHSDDGTTAMVPTFEEMLDASKDSIVLFVELKGNTADHQMVDDAVRMVKERDMVDDVVLISLQYDLIDYAETQYPEMHTGYLTWAGYGNISQLNCDYIGLEGESATATAISSAHTQNKKVMVWTPNTEDEQRKFLLSDADYIITDNIVQANEIIEKLENRSLPERIAYTLMSMLF